MLAIEKMWESTRFEGLGTGLPMTFVKLGPGVPYEGSDTLVREVYFTTKCKWICFLGEDTLKVGMGSVAKGLHSVDLYTEVEVSGALKEPGWIHAIDHWIVDYVKGGYFNYFGLRNQDAVRFDVPGMSPEEVKEAMEELSMFPIVKYIRITPEAAKDKKLVAEYREVVRGYDRSRLYIAQPAWKIS